MHALLFEVEPRPGHGDHYFEHAARLRPIVDAEPGMLFIDRYQSLARDGVILSHSLWQDEAALSRWRTNAKHHASQSAGRTKHFQDYRIRIAEFIGHMEGGTLKDIAPPTTPYNDPAAQAPRFVVIVKGQAPASLDRVTAQPNGDGETYLSVNTPGNHITVTEAPTLEAGEALIAGLAGEVAVESAVLGLVARDYGMFERGEAPQYYPEVARPEDRSGG